MAEAEPFQNASEDDESRNQPPRQPPPDLKKSLPAQKPRSRWHRTRRATYRVFRETIVHLLPIAITITTVTFTFRQTFWTMPTSNTNTILNLLQFAAQFHGSLIVASLAAILLHVLVVQLRKRRGLPLGVLTSSYQLNSLTYLFRSELWETWNRRNLGDKLYVVFYLLIFALAFACQPSSAIAMIPRLQYWPITEFYPQNAIKFRAYVRASADDLYPDRLTARHVPTICLQSTASNIRYCPSSGIKKILGEDGLFAMPGDSSQPSINLTIDSDWRRQIIGFDSGINIGVQSSYQTRTLSNFLGMALSGFQSYLTSVAMPFTNIVTLQRKREDISARYDLTFRSGNQKIPTQRPYARIECSVSSPSAEAIPFPQTNLAVPTASNLFGQTDDPTSASVNFTWFDLSQFATGNQASASASLFFVFAMPVIYESGAVGYNISQYDPSFALYGCTIQAQWESTNVFYEDIQSSGDVDFSHANSKDVVDMDANSENLRQTRNQIQIDRGFAEALSAPYLDDSRDSTSTNISIMQAIGEKCIRTNAAFNRTAQGTPFPDGESHYIVDSRMQMTHCLQTAIGVYTVDALSRVQDSIPAYFVASGRTLDRDRESVFRAADLYDFDVNAFYEEESSRFSQSEFDDLSRFTEIDMPMSRYGYGYGFADSRLIYFAIVILFIHIAVCIAHIVWVSVSRVERLGWDSLGELVALLLAFSDAEQGVPLTKKKPNWRDRVVVKEMNEEEMVKFEKQLPSRNAKQVKQSSDALILRRIPYKVNAWSWERT
jgi:hypothetical protein